jgi:hypothetical protein
MQQYREGQRLKGSDGNIYVVQGGVPRLASSGGPNVVVPAPVDPFRESANARDDARLRLAQEAAARAAANSPSPNEKALREQLLAAQVQAAQAAAEKARKGNAGANIGDAKSQQRSANLNALGNQLKHVRSLWEKNLKGGMPNVIAGNVPDALRPENGAFESAAAGLGEIGLAAFRVPGVGSQSDAELRQFVNANTPQPGDSDAKIEEKLRNLQNRLDSTLQAMGQAPAKQEEQAPPAYIGGDGEFTTEAGQVRDPRFAGIEGQYRGMLAKGEAPGKIIQFLRQQGINANPQDVVEQARWVKQNPGKINQLDTSQIEMVWRDKVTRNTLGIAPESALGAYGVSAANALTAGTLDEIAGGESQIAKEVLRQRNPGASLAGDISGAALGMTGVNAGFRGLGGVLGKLATRGGGIGTDLLYGAAYGAGENNDDRAMGAVTGAASAGAGNLVGRGIVSGVGKTVRGVSDPALQYLASRNIPVTPGQIAGQGGMIGRGMRAIEDAVESVPYLGSAVRSRREEGLQAFNREAFKDALRPINQQVQDTIGQDAIGEAQDLVGDAYGSALGSVNLRPDGAFIRQTDDILKRGSAVPVMGDQFNYLMGQKIDPLFTPELSGRNFQAALQTMNKAKSEFNKQGIMGNEVASASGDMRDAFIEMANRQAPGAMPALNAANAANKNVSILGDAVTQAVNSQVESGMFTPAQLARMAVNNTKKFGGKKAAARGDVPFRELTEAGQSVLPSRVNNSGTADRAWATMILPAALGGSAAGSQAMGLDPSVTASLAGLAALSTKKGNKLVEGLALKRNPQARAIGEAILRQRRAAGMFGAGAAIPLLGGY